MKWTWIKGLNKPTPVKVTHWGHSLLAASTFLTGGSIYTNYAHIAYISAGLGLIGTLLINMYHEEENANNPNQH